MQKVLILDANQRSALAATRSLGKRGIPVAVADTTEKTLAGSSTYCKETFTYPSPYEFPEDFIGTLKEELNRRGIHVVFPMTEISSYLVLKYRNEFADIQIPFVPFEAFDLLTNKWKLFELSQKLGIPTPKTYFINKPEDILNVYPKLEFPVVLKPYRSRILSNGNWIAASVEYADSIAELEDTVQRTSYLNNSPFLIQEYVPGEGRGIFTLYNQGKPIAFFAHRRLREKPPSGGVSVFSESVEVDPVLKQLSQKILDYVKWHGVAMVEYKVSHDGTPYLMEVNARFWGSLQLAVDAGVDFPWLLYQLATGGTVQQVHGYKIGVKSRWLLGDFDHLYMRLFKQEVNGNHHCPGKLQTLMQFLDFFNGNTRYEINKWDDPKPFFFELKQYVSNLKHENV